MKIIAKLKNLNTADSIYVVLKKSRFNRFYWEEIFYSNKKEKEELKTKCSLYIERKFSKRRWENYNTIKIKLLEEDFEDNCINLCELP